MIRPVLILALLTGLAGVARADYVTSQEGGYGPFLCEKDGGGALPAGGFDEIFTVPSYAGTCQRWRGDVDIGSGHPGRLLNSSIAIRSVRVSPQNTGAYVCDYIVAGNVPPCHIEWGLANDANVPTVSARAHVPGWGNPCPLTPGMTQIHVCTGSDWTPYDGSGLVTAVISDGIPQNGLPRGSPLKNQSGGPDVSCVATVSDYPLTPPPGTPAVVMAVYACP